MERKKLLLTITVFQKFLNVKINHNKKILYVYRWEKFYKNYNLLLNAFQNSRILEWKIIVIENSRTIENEKIEYKIYRKNVIDYVIVDERIDASLQSSALVIPS